MARTPTRYDIKSSEYADGRKAAGRYIAELRNGKGLTQTGLARLLGLEFHTFVSQIETGSRRLPPEDIATWAKVLGVDVQEFSTKLFGFYDPLMYHLVIGRRPKF